MQQTRHNKTPHCSTDRFKYFSHYFATDCCDAELQTDSTEVQLLLTSAMECLPSYEPTSLRSSDVELNRLPSSEMKLLANSEVEGIVIRQSVCLVLDCSGYLVLNLSIYLVLNLIVHPAVN